MRTIRLPFCLALATVILLTDARADELFPDELTHFEPIAANPVFTAAGEGHWDVKIRERGWIMRDGDHWRMWYTGYDGTRPGQKMLGYATSTDGLIWKRDSGSPIYKEHWVEDVCIIPHAGTLYMFAEGEQDRAQLLTSPDGIAWTTIKESVSAPNTFISRCGSSPGLKITSSASCFRWACRPTNSSSNSGREFDTAFGGIVAGSKWFTRRL